MKIQKGDAGYLRRRKRLLILEAVVSFGLVAALVIAGYVTTNTKLNLLTVVAVLGCLPASRILVNLIMVMPHDSIDEATELEISAVSAIKRAYLFPIGKSLIIFSNRNRSYIISHTQPPKYHIL